MKMMNLSSQYNSNWRNKYTGESSYVLDSYEFQLYIQECGVEFLEQKKKTSA